MEIAPAMFPCRAIPSLVFAAFCQRRSWTCRAHPL